MSLSSKYSMHLFRSSFYASSLSFCNSVTVKVLSIYVQTNISKLCSFWWLVNNLEFLSKQSNYVDVIVTRGLAAQKLAFNSWMTKYLITFLICYSLRTLRVQCFACKVSINLVECWSTYVKYSNGIVVNLDLSCGSNHLWYLSRHRQSFFI